MNPPEKLKPEKPEVKSETKLETILWSIECGFETWVLEIESLSKSRLRLKIPKRFEIPQKLILEGWRLSGMSRVSPYIWEEFDETGHNIRVKLSHMHILDILEELEGLVTFLYVKCCWTVKMLFDRCRIENGFNSWASKDGIHVKNESSLLWQSTPPNVHEKAWTQFPIGLYVARNWSHDHNQMARDLITWPGGWTNGYLT